MMKNILLFLAALIALCAASCTPNVVTTQRPGTFQQGGGTAAIFDIVISNAGSCPITSIIIDITLPTGATRGEYWNLVPEAGHYRVTSYEPQLPVGASVNAGLIVIFPNTVSAITVSLFSSVCPTSCTGTVAPTVTPTNPPTVRPTNPPTNTPTNTPTNPPTVRPTNPPTSPPSTTCRPSIVTTQRPATFPLNGGTGAIFDIVITNAGSCPITTIVIDITLPTGATRGEYWNLVPEAGHYRVTSYEPQLQVGATVNAGVIVIFPNTVSAITVSLFSAVCPVSCTGTAAPTVTPTNPPTVRPTNPPTNTPTNTPTNPPTNTPTNPPSNCRPSIVTTQRPGTFQQAGGTAAIFDIVITNSGSCPITTIVIDIALPAGSTRGEYWNLVPEAGHYRVTSYEPQLQVGATVNAGLIVIFPTSSVSAISVNLFSAVCPATCR